MVSHYHILPHHFIYSSQLSGSLQVLWEHQDGSFLAEWIYTDNQKNRTKETDGSTYLLYPMELIFLCINYGFLVQICKLFHHLTLCHF